jgi:hypothetical protein
LTTKTGELIAELNLAKEIMVDNIDKLLDREHRLDIVYGKSENLKTTSDNISNFVIYQLFRPMRLSEKRRESETRIL